MEGSLMPSEWDPMLAAAAEREKHKEAGNKTFWEMGAVRPLHAGLR